MDLLIAATSLYNDPFAEEWQPDLRYTAAFLRAHACAVGFLYLHHLAGPQQLADHPAARAIFMEMSEENRAPVLAFTAALKAVYPSMLTFVGGIPATLCADELLAANPHIDFIVCGERDLTLLEVLQRLRQGEGLNDLAGLQARSFRGAPRPLIADLDSLGSMIHDGLEELLANQGPAERTAYLAGSRGCYAHCSFCGVPDFNRSAPGKPWRGRSPQAIVGEMRLLADKYGITHFTFTDDQFFGPGQAGQRRSKQIASEIIDSGLHIHYSICCRLNDVQADTMQLMKESGLNGLGLSIESTQPDSLALLEKGINPQDIYSTLDLLEELEIPSQVNMIFFDPYLTLNGVRGNLALLATLHHSKYLSYSSAFPLNELVPFHWSRVAQRLRLEGLLDEENETCYFRDPQVARLVGFTQRLKRRLPLTFKNRLLFSELHADSSLATDPAALRSLTRLAAGLRYWVGLVLLPRYIGAACDVLESEGQRAEEVFRELEEKFWVDAAPLRILEKSLILPSTGQ